MSHASRILAQLKVVEEDDELSDDLRESARQRRQELEAEGVGDEA